MPDIGNIARAALAAGLPTQEVATAAFRRTKLHSPIKMPVAITSAAALVSTKKDGWQAGVSHAQSTCDPELLDRLSRDPRLQIRRAVAHNVHTSEETRRYLYNWAATHDDIETLSHLAERIDVEWVLRSDFPDATDRCVHFHESRRRTQLLTLIGRAADEAAHGRPGAMQAALDAKKTSIDHALGIVCRNSRVPGFSLADVVHYPVANFYEPYTRSSDPATQRALVILEAALSEPHVVDEEFAKLLAEYASVLNVPVNAVNTTTAGTPEATQILMDSLDTHPGSLNWILAARIATKEEHLDVILRTEQLSVIYELQVRMRTLVHAEEGIASLLTQRQWADFVYVVNNVANLSPPFFAKVNLFESKTPPPLDAATVLELVRDGDPIRTVKWLSGQTAFNPEPGQVLEFVKNPRRALGSLMSSTEDERVVRSKIVACLDGEFEQILTQPWADELADALSVEFFARASYSRPVMKYIIDRLTKWIGVGLEAWEIVFGLLATHEGSVGQMVNIVTTMLKAQNVDLVFPEPAPELPMAQLSWAI